MDRQPDLWTVGMVDRALSPKPSLIWSSVSQVNGASDLESLLTLGFWPGTPF
jgi:hypothetical protein